MVLVRQQRLKANPARGIALPKQGRPLPKNLDVDQVYQLLNITDEGDPLAIRDRAMMELFYSAGLRLAELVALNVALWWPMPRPTSPAGVIAITPRIAIGAFSGR